MDEFIQALYSFLGHPIVVLFGGGILVNLLSRIVEKFWGKWWGQFSETQRNKNTIKAQRQANLIEAVRIYPNLRLHISMIVIDNGVFVVGGILLVIVLVTSPNLIGNIAALLVTIMTLVALRRVDFFTNILRKSLQKNNKSIINALLGDDSNEILKQIKQEVGLLPLDTPAVSTISSAVVTIIQPDPKDGD